MDSLATLTLAVIVKDEAELLERLLTHHRDLVDEMVVVDTGSRDSSVHVARAAGALVECFSWCDDFSAARNCALARASGQAVLCLDCDEIIARPDFPAVRKLAAAVSQGIAWILAQRNYTNRLEHPEWEPSIDGDEELTLGAAGFLPAYSIRIFPNLPQMRYQGLVHETLDAAVEEVGLEVRQGGVPVHHHGHLIGGNRVSRNEFYGRLLRREIRRRPHDSRVRFELATQLVAEGRLHLAQRLLTRTVKEAPGGAEVHRARLLLGRLLLERGRLAAALEQFDRAVQERPDWRPGWAATVRALGRTGRFQEARLYLDGALKLFPSDPALLRLEAQVFANLADIEGGSAMTAGGCRDTS